MKRSVPFFSAAIYASICHAFAVFAVLSFCFAAVAQAQAQWQPPVRLSTVDTGARLNENMGHCLAVSGDSIFVVWADANSGAIFFKRSWDNGTSWSTDSTLVRANADFP